MKPIAVLVVLAVMLVTPPDCLANDGGNTMGEGTPEPEQTGLEKAHAMMEKARERVEGIEDYTAVFHKQEYVDGELLPEEVVEMKVRRKPRRIYMRWVGDAKEGQELLWGEKWNDGKIRAHPGGWLGFVTVNIDPESSKAMKDNRHSVAEAGFGHTINLIARDLKTALKHPEYVQKIRDLGEKKIYGQKAHGFEAWLRKDKYSEFYGYRARVWIHDKLHLPVRIQIWEKEDGAVRLVENYGYEKIKINAGLSDEDFDPDNPEYKF